MARTFTLPFSLPQSQNLNQILSTQFNQKSIINLLWTRKFSPIFHNSNSINRNNNVFLHVRRIPSFCASSLPSCSYSNLPICSSSNCICFSSVSLLPLCRSRLSFIGLSVMSQRGEDGSISPQDSAKTIRCVIKGRVQGVFYRNWTIENASQLGLKGWVRNRRDGSVEALFSGKAETVDEMLQRCRRGPPDAMVTALEANPSNEDPGTGFERKPTV
ncbi:uncharacterized protein LOC130813355 isoform X2 [Amaranthus tricolor]|uniref:uncharacterized protein LOC130813355 isoform X2 n=1 Tax=Amaranthus tricolor TaxID=29722 RepID=UPI00258B7439|nr:uncharacterized protein LOC130813355 isoform X2 [Amaranthus tricolor]